MLGGRRSGGSGIWAPKYAARRTDQGDSCTSAAEKGSFLPVVACSDCLVLVLGSHIWEFRNAGRLLFLCYSRSGREGGGGGIGGEKEKAAGSGAWCRNRHGGCSCSAPRSSCKCFSELNPKTLCEKDVRNCEPSSSMYSEEMVLTVKCQIFVACRWPWRI